MANNFTPVGDEIQVNLNPNHNLYQDDPDVAVLIDGRFFVAFEDDDGDNIIGQFVNPDGTLAGANLNIDVGTGSQFDPAVSERSSGAAIVVWQDSNASEEIQYSVITGTGTVGAEQIILPGTGANGFYDPDVATLANGSSLVVARQVNANDDIIFRFIDAAGAPGAPADFIDNGTGDQRDTAVAAFGNNALVVYVERNGDDSQIQGRFYDGTGFAAEVTLGLGHPEWEVSDADVASLTDGRFIVVWQDDFGGNAMGRFVNAAGVPEGAAFNLTPRGGYDYAPRVAALPDGGFIVASENYASRIAPEDSSTSAIVARRFDATGAPVGDPFIVNTGDPETDQADAAVATNKATGQTFFAWADDHSFAGGDTDPRGVRGRAFLPTTDIVNGSAGDDVITTYGLSEPINGLDGDDLINGLGGDDVIHGGTGFDHIKGGSGNDQIFGDDGDDLLKGEDGDDLLVGGRGRDILFGGSGKDTFDFNALSDSRAGANHDVISAFSRAEDDLIDLKTLDADKTTGGNQKFDLIGTAGFSGTAGELRFAAGLLQGDTDGNGIANFEIKVGGLQAPVNGDFVL